MTTNEHGILAASKTELLAIWIYDNDLFRLMPFGRLVYLMKFQGVKVSG